MIRRASNRSRAARRVTSATIFPAPISGMSGAFAARYDPIPSDGVQSTRTGDRGRDNITISIVPLRRVPRRSGRSIWLRRAPMARAWEIGAPWFVKRRSPDSGGSSHFQKSIVPICGTLCAIINSSEELARARSVPASRKGDGYILRKVCHEYYNWTASARSPSL
jgi:hypothetical protein